MLTRRLRRESSIANLTIEMRVRGSGMPPITWENHRTFPRKIRIPLPLVSDFQRNYLGTFSGIGKWHGHVRSKLLRDGWITTFMGRQRWFFGRRWDDETVRSAVAFEPQSAIADYLNRGLLAVWR